MMSVFQIFLLLVLLGGNLLATEWYVSAASGDDRHSGITPDEALQTWDALQQKNIEPGDCILLKSGDTFTGMLQLEVKGTKDAPILIGKYDGDAKPILDGNGDFAALQLINPEYIIVENLEIMNPKARYGIFYKAKNAGELKSLEFRFLDVHDVNDASRKNTEPGKAHGGIVGQVDRGEQASWWNGISIHDCYIHDLGTCGVTIGSRYKLHKNEKDYDPHPFLNVHIYNNRVENIVRDGIWIRECKGAIVEHNTVTRTGLVATSNGIWFWDCEDCVMQFNEGFECKAPFEKDGAPFSIDNLCRNCMMQYNYSHDNEGPGYMVFGRTGTGHGSVVRNNLSVNDYVYQGVNGCGSIACVSQVTDVTIENNIIVAGRETKKMLGHRDWLGYPISVSYRGNLFVGNSRAEVWDTVLPAGSFKDNLFINVPNLPEALQSQTNATDFFEAMQIQRDIIDNAGVQ